MGVGGVPGRWVDDLKEERKGKERKGKITEEKGREKLGKCEKNEGEDVISAIKEKVSNN